MMEIYVCLGLLFPFVAFVFQLFSSNFISRKSAAALGCSSILLSFFCFLHVLYYFLMHQMAPFNFVLFQWIPIEGINADFKLHIDSLSLLMTMIITGIGFLIHFYSIGYMDDDLYNSRYFACMNFFVFNMLLLVLAGNLLLLFVGWEGVGLASYLLIGFYYTRPAAAKAATKAFVVNRVGDFGFLIGLLLIFSLFGTSDIVTISSRAGKEFAYGAPILTIVTLLLFMGATGKSAQLPLHTWLADAMEGPTPVSALIHAATMVTAGVYMIVRLHTLFVLTPFTLQVIGVVGGVTSLFASLSALGQTDLKRVLAYSTISQLGLMFLACGAGAFYAAMFHLTTHAFMKSLLFLSAGNIVHMMHGVTDMGKMGGLSKKFPVTTWLFLIGALALSGIPPFAAFFSKDFILEQEYLAGFHFLYYIGLAASILTGVYMMRAFCLTFLGPSLTEQTLYNKIKEAPKTMLAPLFILAFLCIFGGLLGVNLHNNAVLPYFLSDIGLTPAERELSHGFYATTETWLAIGGAFFGVIAATFVYTLYSQNLGAPLQVLKKAFYFDAIYNTIFTRPLSALANWINSFFEPNVINAPLKKISESTNRTAKWLQQFQSGQIRSYLAWMILGMAFLLVYLVF